MILPVVKSGAAENPKTDSGATEQNKVFDALSPEFYKENGGAFEITKAILTRLAQAAKEHGAQSIMLTLGSGMSEFENGKMKPASMLPHEQLIHAALSLGFSDALALSPFLAVYKGKENLFFPVDRHWTAVATTFVAPAVADLIVRTTVGHS